MYSAWLQNRVSIRLMIDFSVEQQRRHSILNPCCVIISLHNEKRRKMRDEHLHLVSEDTRWCSSQSEREFNLRMEKSHFQNKIYRHSYKWRNATAVTDSKNLGPLIYTTIGYNHCESYNCMYHRLYLSGYDTELTKWAWALFKSFCITIKNLDKYLCLKLWIFLCKTWNQAHFGITVCLVQIDKEVWYVRTM